MSADKECYRELEELLEDVSPSDIYKLLDMLGYYIVLTAEYNNQIEGMSDNFYTLRQVRDVFGAMSKQAS